MIPELALFSRIDTHNGNPSRPRDPVDWGSTALMILADAPVAVRLTVARGPIDVGLTGGMESRAQGTPEAAAGRARRLAGERCAGGRGFAMAAGRIIRASACLARVPDRVGFAASRCPGA